MPPIGALGHVDFSNLFINLSHNSYPTIAMAKAAGQPTLNYGLFLNSVVNFLIIAFAIFLLLRMVSRWLLKPAPAAAPTTRDCPQCLMAIPIAAKSAAIARPLSKLFFKYLPRARWRLRFQGFSFCGWQSSGCADVRPPVLPGLGRFRAAILPG